MQLDQALVAMALAAQSPAMAATADSETITPHTPHYHLAAIAQKQRQGFGLRRERLHFTAKGWRQNADSEALLSFAQEAANLSKVYRNYPQAAFVTFRMHVSF